ncbi:hypothetical protein G6F51_014547 [Rhizopus arrhizus]|uniref:Uncharacterized protein n=1 Tax=Rhizopus oryzae TaxID=64495 RepID=A0A9P7BY08_RHIOR|nr:hypothetical protein G6F51_014547 [Rhizopus arrhizus]
MACAGRRGQPRSAVPRFGPRTVRRLVAAVAARAAARWPAGGGQRDLARRADGTAARPVGCRRGVQHQEEDLRVAGGFRRRWRRSSA